MDAGDLSWHHQAHDIESVFTVLSLLIAPLLLALAFRRLDGWEDLVAPSWAVFILLLGCIAAFVPLYDNSARGVGLVQMLAITLGAGWMALVSWRLYQVSSAVPEPARTA